MHPKQWFRRWPVGVPVMLSIVLKADDKHLDQNRLDRLDIPKYIDFGINFSGNLLNSEQSMQTKMLFKDVIF